MKSLLELAKSEGLQNIKLVEKKSESTITFNRIQKLSKINKIGNLLKVLLVLKK